MAIEVDNASGLLALLRSQELNDDVVFIGDFQRTILELSCMAVGAQQILRDFIRTDTNDPTTARKLRAIQRNARVALEWLNTALKKTYDDDTIPKFIWDRLPED